MARAQLAYAGLAGFFEQILSVEAVRRFKPAAETYLMAAGQLGVEPSELRLIAAHNWDVNGALRSRCAAAFVARSGMALGPLDDQPDIEGADLCEVVNLILRETVGEEDWQIG